MRFNRSTASITAQATGEPICRSSARQRLILAVLTLKRAAAGAMA